MKTLNLVYDVWDGNNPKPNGYDHGNEFDMGDCVINHARINTKHDEFGIKNSQLSSVIDYPNEKFYYVINYHCTNSFITNHVEVSNDEYNLNLNGPEVITDKIKDYLRNYENFFIMLITEHEPVPEIDFIKIVKYFELNDIDTKKVFMVNNNYKMDEYKITYNLNVNTFKTNFLQNNKIKDLYKLGESKYITDKKGKFFMTYNKSLKAHRVFLLSFLIKYELINNVNWSYVPNVNERFNVNILNPISHEDYSNEINYLNNLKFKLSDYENTIYTYDKDNDNEKNKVVEKLTEFENNETYENSYVNITTESNFDQYKNTVHISEKSYKPFYFYQLPIFVASKHHVKTLREKYGFDMFDDIINHDYDEIEDNEKRLKMIFEEIKRVHQNKESIIQFFNNNQERFEKNKKRTLELLKLVNDDYWFYKNLI